MKLPLVRAAHVALVVSLLCAACAVQATSVLAPRFETMVKRADLIFTGRMKEQHGEWRQIAGQRSIVTLVTFDVTAVHKGNAGPTVTLQFLGGTVGKVSLDVAEIPRFTAGERAVLFVEGNGLNASPLVGFFHGKFRLEPDGTGQERVVAHDGPISDVAEIGRGAASRSRTRPALTHDQFAARIREAK